jgi:trimeric autotransporter adhesin
MWTRLSSLLAALALAAIVNPTVVADPALAFICANDASGAGGIGTATDSGIAANTACGQNANADGGAIGASTAIGSQSNAFGGGNLGSNNTAVGGSADASGIDSNTRRSATSQRQQRRPFRVQQQYRHWR